MRDQTTVAVAIEMFDGQLIGPEFISALVGIRTGLGYVKPQRYGVTGRRVTKFLCPSSLGQDEGRYPRCQDACHARLHDATAADTAFQIAH